MNPLQPFLSRQRIAYFSMEVALRPEIHTYSGGLGVLAGDTARSSADLELPLVVVTLVSRAGYLRQEIDWQGQQVEHPDPWEPADWAVPLGAKIAVGIEGREVWIRPWLYVLKGDLDYEVPVILLDTNLHSNSPEDREITHYLYGGDERYRLKQEVVLGIGGVRILQALGFSIHTYHLNEGHSALLALELLQHYTRRRAGAATQEGVFDTSRVNAVRELCIFTTHTPVEAGHDQFPYPLVESVLGDYIPITALRQLAGDDRLNMTRLALNLTGYVNGVAKRHAEISHRMFPGYRVHAITNGVHHLTWTSPSLAALYTSFLPEWRHEPEILVRADRLPDEPVWSAHQQAKQALAEKVKALAGTDLALDQLVIGFARRMTGYKRPDLLFTDLDRLLAVHDRYPLQVVLAGKAHPRDGQGRAVIDRVHRIVRQLAGRLKVVFLPNYDMELALYLVSGSDVWLNTPLPPMEASGTSGMKAALNGVLNLGILDGWWIEGCIEGVTGWAIGDQQPPQAHDGDAAALYQKLERTVLPLYYENRPGWIAMMKGAISKNGYYFNSHRMMRRYATEAYIR